MGRLEVLFLGLTCCLAAACAAKVSQSPTRDYSPLSFTKIWELDRAWRVGDRVQKDMKRPVSPLAL